MRYATLQTARNNKGEDHGRLQAGEGEEAPDRQAFGSVPRALAYESLLAIEGADDRSLRATGASRSTFRSRGEAASSDEGKSQPSLRRRWTSR